MQGFSLFLFVFLWLSADAQVTVPSFVANATHSDSIRLAGLIKVSAGFEVFVILTSNSYWYNPEVTYAIGYKEGLWRSLKIVHRYDQKSYKVRTSKSKLKQSEYEEVWNVFIKNNLLNLSNDSLNNFCKTEAIPLDPPTLQLENDKNGNPVYTIIATRDQMICREITDGTTYEFIVKGPSGLRIINSYMPDEYYRWNPEVVERMSFMLCRDAFYSLFQD